MSVNFSVKMNEQLYRDATRFFGKGKVLNRNSFINRAVEFFVQANARRKLADEFKRASLAQRSDPKVMAEIREWEQTAAADNLHRFPYTP